jgi:hypothetical protein
MTDADVKSLREWLASWPAGKTWVDETGAMVPIPKTTLQALLDDRDKWKKRAEQHGCDVNNGDPECG